MRVAMSSEAHIFVVSIYISDTAVNSTNNVFAVKWKQSLVSYSSKSSGGELELVDVAELIHVFVQPPYPNTL